MRIFESGDSVTLTFEPGEKVTDAVQLANVLFRKLDREVFYLLSRELNARLFQTVRMVLAGWMKAKAENVDVKHTDSGGGNGCGRHSENPLTFSRVGYVELSGEALPPSMFAPTGQLTFDALATVGNYTHRS